MSPTSSRPGGWYWPILNVLQFLFVFSWTCGWISIALVTLLLTRSRKAVFHMARHYFGPGILWCASARLEVEGLEHLPAEGACFFVSNHQSAIDIPALYAALPRPLHYILKEELRHVPFIGWFARAVGMIFVDRGDRKRSIRSLENAGQLIRSGRSVICFAEGTRSRDGSLLPFKTGVFVAAIESGVPVFPVSIQGARETLPPDGFRPRPGVIRIRVGEAIPTAGLTHEHRGGLSKQVRQAILELRGEAGSRA